MNNTKMLTVPGKIYYMGGSDTSNGHTDFGAFERDINAMGYELRHYEISVDYNQIMSVIINLCTNKSEHPDKIMGVVAQHGMTTKEMHCNKLGDYLYYNIVAYIGGTFIPPVIRLDPIDPYEDETSNPIL